MPTDIPAPPREPEGEAKLIEDAAQSIDRQLQWNSHFTSYKPDEELLSSVRPILSRLLREAKIAAHEEMARSLCSLCDGDYPKAERRATHWWHPGDGKVRNTRLSQTAECAAGPIWERITKLRETTR